MFPPGVNANDVGDFDDGANEGMNFPEIITHLYAWGSGNTNINGILDTQNPELCEIQIFKAIADDSGHGEAVEYISSVFPNEAGEWYVSIPALDPEQFLTFLAIDSDNNTSEFSITRNSETIAKINLSSKISDFEVFPNPTNGSFSITVPQSVNEVDLKLYDCSGRYVQTLFRGKSETGIINFNTVELGLKAGQYFVRIVSAEIELNVVIPIVNL